LYAGLNKIAAETRPSRTRPSRSASSPLSGSRLRWRPNPTWPR